MSVIHGNWSVEDIRKVIQSLDEKTGLNGASVPIYLYKSLGKGNTLGSYRPGSGKDKWWRSFSFSSAYFNDSNFEDLAVIGVIRGADGPAAIIAGQSAPKFHAACSSLHFEPVDEVEWRVIFSEKLMPDIDVELIAP